MSGVSVSGFYTILAYSLPWYDLQLHVEHEYTIVRINTQGRSQTFSFGGATEGASFATRGAVNGLCRTFRKRPEKFWGGQAKFWRAVVPPGTPLVPPL